MRFVWSLLLFATIVFAVLTPLFIGHALASHNSEWYGIAAVCLVLAGILGFAQRRLRRT